MFQLATVDHFELPALRYAFNALEPAYSAELLELHYTGHHRAYVNNANRAIEALAGMRAKGEYEYINQLESELVFHLSGHVMHSIFWRNLEPNDGSGPAAKLEARIKKAFGTLDALRRQFLAAGTALQGSGWIALSWEATRGSLIVEQVHEHNNNRATSSLPLLVMDLWEHAYYLQYRNHRERWIVAFWDLINWSDVAYRLDNAECANLATDPDEGRVIPLTRIGRRR